MIKQTLKIQDYEVWTRLGCTVEEQKFVQPVHFSVEIEFHKNGDAVNTDRLKDAVDYVVLTKAIKQVAEQKAYHLIEHLCFDISLKLADVLKELWIQGTLKVHVHKIRVPVENLRGGVVFTCETTL